MRKTTLIHYDQMDVQKIVRDELKTAGLSNAPKKLEQILELLNKQSELLHEHTKQLGKMDKLHELMDRIVGEIRDYREEQELNAQKLSEHTDQLEKHEELLEKLKTHTRLAVGA